MPEKKIVSLKNNKGNCLYGILHLPYSPDKIQRKTGVNLLNPGLKNRVAPNRLYVKIAEALSRQGYYVLRMDPSGIGDSEGNLPHDTIADVWGQIQQGLFVSDTVAMNNFFIETCKLDELVLAGSCGGAINALLTAEVDKRVKKMILIDVPVTLSSSKTISEDYLKIIEADDAYRSSISKYYLKSIFNPKKWLRFLTVQSNYKVILKLLIIRIKDLYKKVSKNDDNSDSFDLENLNHHFIRAFKKNCAMKKDIIFLCAEKDTDTQLFNKGFLNVYLKKGNPYEDRYTISTIKDANHIYTLESSQAELLQRILDWLNSQYGIV